MIELFSPAKINLFFKLIGEREDGYHNLESLFQAVSLGDFLTLKFAEQDRFTSNIEELGFNEENFIIKALICFRKETGLNHPVEITLNKKIPMQAGLGGGSSNAATTLWGLNELFDRPGSLEHLFDWAKEITSDSSFFFSLGTALCQNRGDLVQNMPPLQPPSAWLVKPEYGLSTKEVYAETQKNSSLSLSLEELIKSSYSKDPIYHNDLEEAAFSLSPLLKKLKNELQNQGGHSIFMTGSGTGLVCIGKKRPIVKNPVQIFPIQYINRSPNRWYCP